MVEKCLQCICEVGCRGQVIRLVWELLFFSDRQLLRNLNFYYNTNGDWRKTSPSGWRAYKDLSDPLNEWWLSLVIVMVQNVQGLVWILFLWFKMFYWVTQLHEDLKWMNTYFLISTWMVLITSLFLFKYQSHSQNMQQTHIISVCWREHKLNLSYCLSSTMH